LRRFLLATAEDTETFGAALAKLARPGTVFAVSGPLGAGKTCVARGLIRALQPEVPEEIVSPTFTLVQTYDTAAGPVWHFDLYRLKQPEEAVELGYEDALGDICVIEWPERLGRLLPANRIDVALAHAGNARAATIAGHGNRTDAATLLSTTLPELKIASDR
jgi:tRNA threonylcarbamoyladenosine biosynthesis protein TsaE